MNIKQIHKVVNLSFPVQCLHVDWLCSQHKVTRPHCGIPCLYLSIIA